MHGGKEVEGQRVRVKPCNEGPCPGEASLPPIKSENQIICAQGLFTFLHNSRKLDLVL